MKTIAHIKDEVAQEIGYESSENYLSELYEIGSIYTLERIDLFINEVSKRTAKEALKNASENAVLVDNEGEQYREYHDSVIYDCFCIVDKQSILNEYNIPNI